ncbi:MAG TPA: hypothetical protein VE570_01770 [Thermoleophilaceae bacterium]|nr:hypothetical protein [Thermoleophilaceae bacterium]
MPIALDRERVEHALLMRIGPDVEVRERDRRRFSQRTAIVFLERTSELLAVEGRVVGLEMLRCPVALKRHSHARDHVLGVHR